MLVLTRRVGETVQLTTAAGEVIEVVVTQTHKGRAVLGFVAPASVTIWRREVADRMAAERAQGEAESMATEGKA